MSLRIALCGPDPELNDKLIGYIKDLIGNEIVDVTVLPNAYHQVMGITKDADFKMMETDWVNLSVSVARRLTELGAKEDDLVLSSGCGIDQVVIQATYLQSQVEKGTSGVIIADATGQPIDSSEMALLNRAGSVLQVILNQTEEEVAEYWDYIYAVLPAALGFTETPDAILMQYEDFLSSVPVFSDIIKLPHNEEAAQDALSKEADKWKKKLSGS